VNKTVSSLSPLELLEIYWDASHIDPDEQPQLNKLASEIIANEEEIDRD